MCLSIILCLIYICNGNSWCAACRMLQFLLLLHDNMFKIMYLCFVMFYCCSINLCLEKNQNHLVCLCLPVFSHFNLRGSSTCNELFLLVSWQKCYHCEKGGLIMCLVSVPIPCWQQSNGSHFKFCPCFHSFLHDALKAATAVVLKTYFPFYFNINTS